MGIIQNIIDNIKEKREEQERMNEEIPDDVTRDRHLRSLRRERRVQLEELEKIRLKKQIADFQKERSRKYLWGIKEDRMQRLRHARKKKIRESWIGRL